MITKKQYKESLSVSFPKSYIHKDFKAIENEVIDKLFELQITSKQKVLDVIKTIINKV